MSAKWLCMVWLMVAVILPGIVRAEVAPDPYAVSVPVAGQTPADLQRAAGLGLRELAVRISGRSDVENNAALNAATATASRYLEQYRYEKNSGEAGGATPWLAQLRFNRTSVNELLRGAGLIGSAENVVLRVSGIANFNDYSALLNYLARVAAIKTASPMQIANDEVTVQLKTQGNAEQLARQFAAETLLTPIAAEGAQPLQYRWSAPRS